MVVARVSVGGNVAAIFRSAPWQIDQLVSGVQSGSISLPDLQRPFVWPAAKVRDLFDSLFRGYPVGELMFWDVEASGEARSIAGASTQPAAHQIVDGQQRLTSLYAVIKGLSVRDEGYRDKHIKISFNPFTEKFDVRTPAIARSPHWVEDVSTVFVPGQREYFTFIERYERSVGELAQEERYRLLDVFTRLAGLLSYQFQVVHILKDVEKRVVADIFVRINSEGVNLKAYDFILTWLSVFWPDGRDQIEGFARASRVYSADGAWTPKNPFLAVETGHLVRAAVAIGMNRAKLSDAYSALQAKDRTTGEVDSARQERELGLLKDALPIVTNPTNWTEFIRSVQTAGFRSGKNITSATNLISSYVVFLIGRERFRVDLSKLRPLVGRWLFMSQLTSRYTGSAESQLQKDLELFGAANDAAGFESIVNETIATTVTPDFWKFQVPQSLVTSSPALSPHYQCYLASLNVLDASTFMDETKMREWMDPTLVATRGLEGHHLFPQNYQRAVLGITDVKRINQAGNFAPASWDTNGWISDRAPSEYWPKLVAERGGNADWLAKQVYWHALPNGWEQMDYDDFLVARRSLISGVIRDGFERLASGGIVPEQVEASSSHVPDEIDIELSDLIERGLVQPGDQLDPVQADWAVDAVVTDDGTIRIDGLHDFDTLLEAARYLGVENLSGFEFWGVERDGGVATFGELLSELPKR